MAAGVHLAAVAAARRTGFLFLLREETIYESIGLPRAMRIRAAASRKRGGGGGILLLESAEPGAQLSVLKINHLA